MNAPVEHFHAGRRAHIQVLKFDGLASDRLVSQSVGSEEHAGQQHGGGVSHESPVKGFEF
jgi:hypothetical protein